jgi:hypothetical protein
MNTDIYELAAKALIGEELTVEEKTRLQKRNAKYALVRFLYMEKMADAGLKDFQFTPGDEFETIPTIDIVNTLLNINEQLKDAKPFSFGDGSWVNNPPKTGRKKTKLGE